MIIRSARKSEASQIAEVHVNSWKSTYAGIVPDSYLADLSVVQRTTQWERQLEVSNAGTKVFVAENNTCQIVGFASGGPNRSDQMPYDGEIYAIYLLEDYQRQGLGQQLISSMTGFLVEQGHKSMYLWALEDNPYRSFYEKLGGNPAGRKEIQISEKKLQEIAYGWSNLAYLTN
ncbi:GNAT family N-acetyltransferase [Paenibacillus sp. Marseille-Q4541]|uniref:GNAT family N-acetyltransferase n=1 Tax=Paenibacillus sp. Marseille-Q4541 TaxID=2831522 RepID=UPI001BAD7DA1|nr:GNAT family N-acetyltransferase [Paenibacillus sp. Marseille-Q4541]